MTRAEYLNKVQRKNILEKRKNAEYNEMSSSKPSDSAREAFFRPAYYSNKNIKKGNNNDSTGMVRPGQSAGD